MKELKEALGFAISLMEDVAESAEDGKFTLMDIVNFRDSIFKAGEAIDGANKILGEIKALDEAKKAELVAWVKADFDIAQDGIEAKIEGAIQIALGIAMYAVTFLKDKK